MLTDAVRSRAHSSLVLVGLLLAKSMVVVCSLSTSTAGTCLCFYKNLFCFRFLLFTVVPSKWITGNVVLNVRYACISEITLTAILKEVSEVPLVLAFQCFIFLIHYKLNKSLLVEENSFFLLFRNQKHPTVPTIYGFHLHHVMKCNMYLKQSLFGGGLSFGDVSLHTLTGHFIRYTSP